MIPLKLIFLSPITPNNISDKNSSIVVLTKTAVLIAELEKIWGSRGLNTEKATKENQDLYLKFKL